MTGVGGGPRVIVTGAARRVGRAIAEAFARRGASILLTARRMERELDETIKRVRMATAQAGGAPEGASETGIDAALLDLADEASLAAFVADRACEPWDVLVLNAASYAPSTAVSEHEAAHAALEIRRDAMAHFAVNAASAIALCTAFASSLARSALPGGGAIVALGDMHAHGRPVRGFAPYLMSKAALGQMVDSLAVELAPRVRVNSVDPGVVAWPEDAGAELRAAYEARIPLARSGTPEDAAGAVVWLALDAPYLTGVHLRVDGGRWLR